MSSWYSFDYPQKDGSFIKLRLDFEPMIPWFEALTTGSLLLLRCPFKIFWGIDRSQKKAVLCMIDNPLTGFYIMETLDLYGVGYMNSYDGADIVHQSNDLIELQV